MHASTANENNQLLDPRLIPGWSNETPLWGESENRDSVCACVPASWPDFESVRACARAAWADFNLPLSDD